MSGDHHRLVVFNYQLLRVLRLDPPHLIGDGERSITQLLDASQSASAGPGAIMTGADRPSQLTEAVLACLDQQGLAPEDVPISGQRVVLQFDLADCNE